MKDLASLKAMLNKGLITEEVFNQMNALLGSTDLATKNMLRAVMAESTSEGNKKAIDEKTKLEATLGWLLQMPIVTVLKQIEENREFYELKEGSDVTSKSLAYYIQKRLIAGLNDSEFISQKYVDSEGQTLNAVTISMTQSRNNFCRVSLSRRKDDSKTTKVKK